MHAHRFALLFSCCLLAAACSGDKAGANGAQGDDGLPKPAAAGGSVTGMPDPGVAKARPAVSVSRAQAPDSVDHADDVALDDIAPVDPAIAQPVPVEPPPLTLPEPPMSQDPDAPVSSPADNPQTEAQR